ncbi:MAG: biotin carboxylase N-terminal domain-containing protein [Planctomycetota bacterium]
MFHRLLIANRGEVAVRIARACRELGVSPVGVASAPDLEASWVRAMDEVVCLGPAAASESYLDPVRVVQAALQTRCSALHPGWGFLAENPRFATLCRQHGVTFVGPSAQLMELMGVKSPAKAAAREAGLPVLAGSDGPLPDADAAARCAAEVGYPVILKADHGGGGRGMRLCADEAEVREAFAAAGAEARAAFGSSSIYLERYLTGGRHIEVQVLCDGFGTGVHLGERECSVQRKHQKLIEESPSPALSDEERAELGANAAAAALALGYTNAGTIEFLRDSGGAMSFLEMNTRLQVEHPVTEAITGVDIPHEQIRIAAGHRLSVSQADVRFRGHAIECRINAEDPSEDFRPSPGRLEAFDLGGSDAVRVDTHLTAGDEVTPHYDSLLAKVIAYAPTRAEAIETMVAALEAARIEGVSTTIPLHLAVLRSEAFRAGEYDTSSIPGWPVGQ